MHQAGGQREQGAPLARLAAADTDPLFRRVGLDLDEP
jgi:hypothetical protein